MAERRCREVERPREDPDALYVNDYLIFTFPGSGGAVTVKTVTAAKEVITIDSRRPHPTEQHRRRPEGDRGPPHPARLAVGRRRCRGSLHNGNLIVREQFWRRTGDSYTVAPGETMTVSYTRTVGVESVSSSTTEIATSLGLSVSGGLGPLMVSANASLNMSSSSFQQLTTSEETTMYESLQVVGGDKKATWFRWQLTDVVSVYSPSSANYLPLATIVVSQDPVVVTGRTTTSTPSQTMPEDLRIGFWNVQRYAQTNVRRYRAVEPVMTAWLKGSTRAGIPDVVALCEVGQGGQAWANQNPNYWADNGYRARFVSVQSATPSGISPCSFLVARREATTDQIDVRAVGGSTVRPMIQLTPTWTTETIVACHLKASRDIARDELETFLQDLSSTTRAVLYGDLNFDFDTAPDQIPATQFGPVWQKFSPGLDWSFVSRRSTDLNRRQRLIDFAYSKGIELCLKRRTPATACGRPSTMHRSSTSSAR